MRILFADDSMTAQNMGKKILTEAGYEVVAVSNGAAAVKKIAEQKPDIIILDIYMPGYTGLEVCDKVRASVETLRTPVLLTVGKMEPYRPEDANRVRADGVIVKPFEASDLLAVIKKLEERVVPKTVAMADETILLERPPELAEFAIPPSENHTEVYHAASENSVPAMVDVPDNMATSAAFSDLLGPEPVQAFEPLPLPKHSPEAEFSISPEPSYESRASNAEEPARAGYAHEESVVPEFAALPDLAEAMESPAPQVVPHSWEAQVDNAPLPSVMADHVEELAVIHEGSHQTAEPSLPDTQPIPIYQEPELEPTPEVVVSHEAAASVVEEAAVLVSPAFEPGPEREEESVHPLVESSAVLAAATVPISEPSSPVVSESSEEPKAVEVDSFSAKVEAQIQQIETIVSASEARHHETHETHEINVKPAENGFVSSGFSTEIPPEPEDDFEARVAAAMSIYDEPAEDKGAHAVLIDEAGPAETPQEVIEEPKPQPVSFDAPYSFEYSPPARPPVESAAHFATPAEKPEAAVEMAQHVAEEPVMAAPPAVASIAPAATEPIESYENHPSSHDQIPSVPDEPIAVQTAPSRVDDEQIMSEIEAQLPAVTAAATGDQGAEAHGSDTQVIASVVHRVLERLKPHLIEEISRELKSKK